MKTKGRVLFLSYDGMTDPLGQSQVLSYLEGLSKEGHEIHLISYEKPEIFKANNQVIKERIANTSINWHPLFYTKSPPILSTLYDIIVGWKLITKLQATIPFDIVHSRGYIAAVLGRKMKRNFGTKFIFDMRGWLADEKKESGLWNSKIYVLVYNFMKKLEKSFFIESDITISLTYAGRDEIMRLKYKTEDKIPVIPTCVNFNYFPAFNLDLRNQVRTELGIDLDSKVLVYSGSLGGNYSIDTLYQIYLAIYKTDTSWRLLIISKTDRDFIMAAKLKYNLSNTQVVITEAEYKQVGRFLSAGDVGLIYYNKTYSVIGRCPTKMAEYWAVGMPVLSLKGIGDLDNLMQLFTDSGYLLSNISENECKVAAEQLMQLSKQKEKLRAYAGDYFDLSKGVAAYQNVYLKLLR